MKKYIVITTDGFTEDMRGIECENCQMLGIYEAESIDEAAEKCRENLIMWNQAFGNLSIYELGEESAKWVDGIYEDDERLEQE